MNNMQEQLREIMKDVETQPDADLSGNTPVDADDMVNTVQTLETGEDVPEDTETFDPEIEVEEEAPLETMEHLADEFGVEKAELYAIPVPIDGLDEPVTLGQIKDAYQESRQVLDAQQDREAFLSDKQADIERREAALMDDLVSPEELVQAQAAVVEIERSYNAINWSEFEKNAPGEAALQRQKLTEAYQLATNRRDEITGRINATKEQIQAQRQQEQEARMKQRDADLLRMLPAWKDQAVLAKEWGDMQVWALSHIEGFTREQMPLLASAPAGFIKLIHDQMHTSEQLEKVKPVAKAPKAGKPRAASRRKRKSDKDKVIEHAQKSRDTRDKIKGISALIS